jgi:hypothetical protein
MTLSSQRPPRDPSDAAGTPSLLIAIVAAIGIVVGAVIAIAVSGSILVRAGAVVLMVLAGSAIWWYTYTFLNRSGAEPPDTVPAGRRPSMPLGAGLGPERLHAALVSALRDIHGLQRGARHFAEAAGAMLRRAGRGAAAEGVERLFAAQRDLADAQAHELEQRLDEIGAHPSRSADDEALIAASLYEHLLARGVSTNARHAYGLLWLGAVTYGLIERLAATAGDEPTRALAERARLELEPLAERWSRSWDAVLDAEQARNGEPRAVMLTLLEDAHDMEAMRARLLSVSSTQTRAVGSASGVEDAGLPLLVALVEQERASAEDDRNRIDERLRAPHHHPFRRHGFETLAAARAGALVEHVRDYKVVRDLRDLVAADRLESATYDLLAAAAQRAGDAETATLARTLASRERTAAHRVSAELETALEVALLAE